MLKTRIFSFKYALEGILTALKDEPNLRIQLVIGFLGLFFGFFYKITTTQWLLGIIAFGLVFSGELINTAIEEVVDGLTQNIHPSAKKAKDISAAAVFVFFLTEVIVGSIIFLPYIFNI